MNATVFPAAIVKGVNCAQVFVYVRMYVKAEIDYSN